MSADARVEPSESTKTPVRSIVAAVLSLSFFAPLVPLVGSALGALQLRRRSRLGGRGRALAVLALVAGLSITTAQVVLGGVGLRAYDQLKRRSHAAEAPMAINRVRYALQQHLRAHGSFPRGRVGWTPQRPCCAGRTARGEVAVRKRCVASDRVFSSPLWRAIRYRPYGRHSFQYRYRSDGRSARFEARADLDCDGRFSSYVLTARRGPRRVARFGQRTRAPLE